MVSIGLHIWMFLNQYVYRTSEFALLVVNYGTSNTIVLEIPYFTTKPAICPLFLIKYEEKSLLWKITSLLQMAKGFIWFIIFLVRLPIFLMLHLSSHGLRTVSLKWLKRKAQKSYVVH